MYFSDKRNKGILFILGAAFGFAMMSLMVRLAGELPVFQKAFFRNLIASLAALIILLKDASGIHTAKGNLPLLIIRSICGTIGIICNFYAIDNMNIADANMLNKLSPFFALIASYFILKEKASVRDWLTTVFAFTGALLVAKPSFNMSVLPAFIAMAGGLFSGIAYTIVRMLGQRGVKGVLTVFFFSAFSCIANLPLMLADYKPMSAYQLLCLLGAGASAMVGQICITKAYTYAPAKEIGVFDYTQVVYSAALGFLILNQLPDIYSIFGYMIIIGMAVLKWRLNLADEQGA